MRAYVYVCIKSGCPETKHNVGQGLHRRKRSVSFTIKRIKVVMEAKDGDIEIQLPDSRNSSSVKVLKIAKKWTVVWRKN